MEMPPNAGEVVTLVCVARDVASAVDGAPSAVQQLRVSPSTGYVFDANSPTLTYNFQVAADLTGDASIVAAFPISNASVVCTTTSRGSDNPYYARSASVIEATLLRASWPLLQDVVVHFSGGLTRSAWSHETVDLGPSITAYITACYANPYAPSCPDTSTVLDDPTFVETVIASLNLRPGAPGSAFAVTLTGQTPMTLVADTTFYAKTLGTAASKFTQDTEVLLGGIPCNVSWVSNDGSILHLITPPLAALCSNGDGCGYVPLTVTQPGSLPPDSLAIARAQGIGYENAVTVSCPPLCPGAFATGAASALTFPAAVPSLSALAGAVQLTYEPATISEASQATLFLSTVALAKVIGSSGVYVSPLCAVAGAFTDPTSGACSNASDPAAARCAFGSGDSCVLCPTGALCPGGFRLWPQAGYWAAEADKLPVLSCSAPATQRCLGWSEALSASECGIGYRAGSYLCLSCADGFYGAVDGSCKACPSGAAFQSTLEVLLIFIVVVLLFGAINYALLLVITKFAGGTIEGGAARAVSLVVWTFTVVQIISTVGKAAAGNLPQLLVAAYTGLNVFQFGGIIPPVQCLDGAYPFLPQVTQFAVALGLMLTVSVLQVPYRRYCACARRCATGHKNSALALRGPIISSDGGTPHGRFVALANYVKPLIRRIVFTILTLMYPIVTDSVLSTMFCVKSVVSVRSYLAMDGNNATLLAAGINFASVNTAAAPSVQAAQLAALYQEDVAVSQLAADPYFVCYEATHRPAGILAWIVLVVYCAGYPVGTYLLIRSRINRIVAAEWSGYEAEAAQRVTIFTKCASRMTYCKRTVRAAPTAAPLVLEIPVNTTADGRHQNPPHVLMLTNPLAASARGMSSRTSTRQVSSLSVSNVQPRVVPPAAGAVPLPRQQLTAATPTATSSAVSDLSIVSHTNVAEITGIDDDNVEAAVATPDAIDVDDIAPVESCTTFIDNSDELIHSVAFAHFTGSDFRASCFYFRQLDMACLFVLSCALVFWAQPIADADIIGKLVVTLTAVLGLAIFVVWLQPFPASGIWKYHVKVLSLILCAVAAVLNAVIEYSDRGQKSNSVTAPVAGLSIFVFAFSIALFLLLLVGFWRAMISSAKEEQSEMQRTEVARAEAVLVTEGSFARRFTSLLSRRGAAAFGFSTRQIRVADADPTPHEDSSAGNNKLDAAHIDSVSPGHAQAALPVRVGGLTRETQPAVAQC